jgi:hypothetical protein
MLNLIGNDNINDKIKEFPYEASEGGVGGEWPVY